MTSDLSANDRGYDAGYKETSNFWGIEPASLVRKILEGADVRGLRVLDLGAGEGKNANAFASAGASVDAIETSADAISNGRVLFPGGGVNWLQADFFDFQIIAGSYDIVVAYGVLHCMRNVDELARAVSIIQCATRPGGLAIICAFNARSQDLSAHPGFNPLLVPHDYYTTAFSGWDLLDVSDADLHETHPNNNIPHHHSLTRMIARRPL